MLELQSRGFTVQSEYPIKVYYNGEVVGDYRADIIVDNKIILEIKAAEEIRDEFGFQLINYLKATDFEVGLLFNFGKDPEFQRRIFTNDRKKLIKK